MAGKLPELVEGHAPITLQQAFGEAVEAYGSWPPGASEPVVSYDGQSVRISAVFASLRECNDILPLTLLVLLKDHLPKPLNYEGSVEEVPFATAARVMNILVRRRLHIGP